MSNDKTPSGAAEGRLNAVVRPFCNCHGNPAKGGVCGAVTVGGKFCTSTEDCEHKRTPRKLTTAQQRTLQKALNEGTIIFGGIDKTIGVRRDVVRKLGNMGYLKLIAPGSIHIEQQWAPTQMAKSLEA